jgi:hypothetical protein
LSYCISLSLVRVLRLVLCLILFYSLIKPSGHLDIALEPSSLLFQHFNLLLLLFIFFKPSALQQIYKKDPHVFLYRLKIILCTILHHVITSEAITSPRIIQMYVYYMHFIRIPLELISCYIFASSIFYNM